MEKKLYEVALREWQCMEPIGTSFSPQMQKDVSVLKFDTAELLPLFVCTRFFMNCLNAIAKKVRMCKDFFSTSI